MSELDRDKTTSGAGTAAAGVELLAGVTLFSELHRDVLAGLVERCSVRAYDRGTVVWHAGDEADELLVVMSGELEVRRAGDDGTEELLGRIGPGECAGEMALVLNERRSATIVCRRRTKAMVLLKEEFLDLARNEAGVLANLTKLLSRRAFALVQGDGLVRSPVVVGVAAEPGTPGASLVARALAHLGGDMLDHRAVLVRIDARAGTRGAPVGDADISVSVRRPLPPTVDLAVGAGADEGAVTRAIEQTIAALGGRFGLVVVDLPPLSSRAVAAAGGACDHVVQVVNGTAAAPGGQSGVLQVVNLYGGGAVAPPLNHCEPFVLPMEPLLDRASGEGSVLALSDRTLPAARVLGRLTRKVLGATVGIALGGGGAFGIAHVGVLAALAEAELPVDLVAGTSMGSIVALGYASGLQPQRMMEIARRIGNVRTALSAIDPSLTGTGLLSGRRLVSIFAPLLLHERFDELELPCRVVAMDVETGERIAIGAGRLDQAFRASCSIPVVFKPVCVGERTLVDGGMIDPVPTDVAREMGADIVIAVNVVPHLQRGVSTALSRTFKRVSNLNPLSYLYGVRNMPDIVDVFMNSLQATQYELGNFKSLDADVLVNVDMAEFTWIDFHRAMDIIQRGHEAGAHATVKVRAAMKERLTPLM